MCHFFLALPLLALPVFWLWPLPVALPLYTGAAALSLLAYTYAWKAWRVPRHNGLEAMLGLQGKVIAVGTRDITLQLGSELWSAQVAGELLRIGDKAEVIGADGLVLRARRAASDSRPNGSPRPGHERPSVES
jgi:membrane protein implicated in regulation of membrane protease activity